MQTKTKLLWKHIRAFFKRNANEMLAKFQLIHFVWMQILKTKIYRAICKVITQPENNCVTQQIFLIRKYDYIWWLLKCFETNQAYLSCEAFLIMQDLHHWLQSPSYTSQTTFSSSAGECHFHHHPDRHKYTHIAWKFAR